MHAFLYELPIRDLDQNELIGRKGCPVLHTIFVASPILGFFDVANFICDLFLAHMHTGWRERTVVV